ncbi:MAG: ABC transporter substrate-binding protein, partial [Ilumatobacteraceae bacterium]
MRKSRIKFAVAGLAALSLIAAACGGSDSSSDTTAAAEEGCTELTPVKLQLQWFIQAQFAGYFAAQDQGFYEAQCLDVEIVEGGVDIVPQQQLADGAVDFALSWVPKALASREAGA